jgi:hypothetical protein
VSSPTPSRLNYQPQKVSNDQLADQLLIHPTITQGWETDFIFDARLKKAQKAPSYRESPSLIKDIDEGDENSDADADFDFGDGDAPDGVCAAPAPVPIRMQPAYSEDSRYSGVSPATAPGRLEAARKSSLHHQMSSLSTSDYEVGRWGLFECRWGGTGTGRGLTRVCVGTDCRRGSTWTSSCPASRARARARARGRRRGRGRSARGPTRRMRTRTGTASWGWASRRTGDTIEAVFCDISTTCWFIACAASALAYCNALPTPRPFPSRRRRGPD